MKIVLFLICLASVFVMSGMAQTSFKKDMPADALILKSPDQRLELSFALVDGSPQYSLTYGNEPVVLPSRMGFTLVGRKNLDSDFKLTSSETNTYDGTWEPVLGEESLIRNHYNELLVTLEQHGALDWQGKLIPKATIMQIRFRLFDDGLAFRYEFPYDNALTYFNIQDEVTEFAMFGDHTAWWIPGDYDTQEYNYTESKLSEIPERAEEMRRNYDGVWSVFSTSSVQTALQMKTATGLYLNIHEAAALNFPTLNLLIDTTTLVFHAALTRC